MWGTDKHYENLRRYALTLIFLPEYFIHGDLYCADTPLI